MCYYFFFYIFFFFFKQKTAYEIKECDWSSDVCSSDLAKLNCNLYFYIEKQWARGQAFKRKVKRGEGNDKGVESNEEEVAMSAVTEANIVGQYRFIRGIVLTLGYNVYAVAPRTWQIRMFGRKTHGDSKLASSIVAQQLYPEVSLLPTERSRKASDGMSDSLLIAEYGRIICKTTIPG